MLEARGLGLRVGERWLLKGVDLEVGPGEFWAVLGPNGSGKSTLLRLLAGEVSPSMGEVRLKGRPLALYRPKELARLRAVLSQTREMTFPFTAYEVAFLGRLPHLGGRETPLDHEKTAQALQAAQAWPLADRLFATLSGGEAMRVEAARLLAQEGEVFLLDEPTNHLDPRHALELLGLFHRLTREGRSVVAVLHDLNLAALFADRVLLLKEGKPLALGEAKEVLRPEPLGQAYGVEFTLLAGPGGRPVLMALPSLALKAERG
ncbi:Transporter [Thermus sp. CCB_US3_UF1]|uniref:ABC transporter ATP-binding protein n=1 Tax=Thermus sp. CCB_US3_UF1 TaxID=1111069 RepID=UPI000238A119|nr:ABC transporter ATP-binding protein [Thermus sp. CCB_US3_UF1]AEV16196.1 Transporter [Thermus sp. CCB_US3_UF1]